MRSPIPILEPSAFCRSNHRTPAFIRNRCHLGHVSVVAVLCSLLAVLAGCQQPARPVSYENLCGMSSEQMGKMNEAEVRQWLEQAYGQETARNAVGDEILVTTGQMPNDGVVTAYLHNGRLSHVQFQEIKNGPSLGQVVTGLGTPETMSHDVRSYGSHVAYFIGLDYPELGISVEAWGEMTPEELEEWTITLREDLRVDWVSCYLPGLSLEQVLREVYGVSPDAVQSEMNRRKSWPGFGAAVPMSVP